MSLCCLSNRNSLASFAIAFILLLGTGASAQTTANATKNNPYSPSPSGKDQGTSSAMEMRDTVARRMSDVRKKVELSSSSSPTEIYNIGIGDVLFVNLKNSAQGSRECVVRQDGTIDFPLAGEHVVVVGRNVDTIRNLLVAGITLFKDPKIEVSVRKYASHKVTVSGLVENVGEISLQREAIPLYVIRSEAAVYPNATKVVIKRAPQLKIETYGLREALTSNILIYPGNSIDFQ
jgi:protein involved in polysaccharide export with SLBB domain